MATVFVVFTMIGVYSFTQSSPTEPAKPAITRRQPSLFLCRTGAEYYAVVHEVGSKKAGAVNPSTLSEVLDLHRTDFEIGNQKMVAEAARFTIKEKGARPASPDFICKGDFVPVAICRYEYIHELAHKVKFRSCDDVVMIQADHSPEINWATRKPVKVIGLNLK